MITILILVTGAVDAVVIKSGFDYQTPFFLAGAVGTFFIVIAKVSNRISPPQDSDETEGDIPSTYRGSGKWTKTRKPK